MLRWRSADEGWSAQLSSRAATLSHLHIHPARLREQLFGFLLPLGRRSGARVRRARARFAFDRVADLPEELGLGLRELLLAQGAGLSQSGESVYLRSNTSCLLRSGRLGRSGRG
jgi:hypothetical protein